jgi:hypothetical protein
MSQSLVASEAAVVAGNADAEVASDQRAALRPDWLYHAVLLGLSSGVLLMALLLSIRGQSQVILPGIDALFHFARSRRCCGGVVVQSGGPALVCRHRLSDSTPRLAALAHPPGIAGDHDEWRGPSRPRRRSNPNARPVGAAANGRGVLVSSTWRIAAQLPPGESAR